MIPQLTSFWSRNRSLILVCVLIVLVIGCIFYFRNCRSGKTPVQEATVLQAGLKEVHDDFTKQTNTKGHEVTSSTPIVADENAIKELSAQIFALSKREERLIKRVEYLTHITQQAKAGEGFIPFEDPDESFAPRTDSIAVPQPFAYSDSIKFISGTIQKTGVRIDSAGFAPDEQYIRGSLIRTGFLRLGREYRVDVLHSNPAYVTTGQSSARIPKHVSQWNKWIKPTIAALIAGASTYMISR